MKITEALKSLDNSWSRNDVLSKIKKGENSEKILNDFLDINQSGIETLSDFITPKDEILLRQIEDLSICEAKLINKIRNYKPKQKKFSNHNNSNGLQNKFSSFKIGIFMMKWSNKFVFLSLLLISAIALSKQAWA